MRAFWCNAPPKCGGIIIKKGEVGGEDSFKEYEEMSVTEL